MKKLRVFLYALLCMLLTVCGCGTEMIDESAISDSIAIVEDLLAEDMAVADEIDETEDIASIGGVDDAQSVTVEENELSDYSDEAQIDVSSDDYAEDADLSNESSKLTVKEEGTYTSRDEVALYIHTYGKLPSNFITKSEAEALGWVSREGNLDEVAPGMSIGGNRYGNYEQLLPDGNYKECDINYHGGYRGDERLVYSDEGDIYYTDDHYGTFTQLYSGEDE